MRPAAFPAKPMRDVPSVPADEPGAAADAAIRISGAMEVIL